MKDNECAWAGLKTDLFHIRNIKKQDMGEWQMMFVVIMQFSVPDDEFGKYPTNNEYIHTNTHTHKK